MVVCVHIYNVFSLYVLVSYFPLLAMPRLQLWEVRQRCRYYSRQFQFSQRLFGRIPMYIFQYFLSPDPLAILRITFDQMEIMNIFMLINGISADLMVAFYAAAGHDVEVVFLLHDYFRHIWHLYRTSLSSDLLGIFGHFYSYHLETRSLRMINFERVVTRTTARQGNYFVPNHLNWRRSREVRRLFSVGRYQIDDFFDLDEFRMAWYGGFQHHAGRYNSEM